MGPLFSLFLAAIAGAILVGVAYCGLRFRHSAGRALILAVAFVVGAGLGFVAAILAAIPIVGIGGTLESTSAVIRYLSWLGACSLAGAIVAVFGAARVLAKRARAAEGL